MWRKAKNSLQKKAVIDGLFPITADEYLKAMIFFAGDEDESIWQAAIEKIKDYKNTEIKKYINIEIPENSALALLKTCRTEKRSFTFHLSP